MANQDSVAIFAEGTFEEQALELAEYVARSKPEADQAAFKQSTADTIKSVQGEEAGEPDTNGKKKVISQLVDNLDGIGEGSDREIEGFFNLITAHLLANYEPDSPELTQLIAKVLVAITDHNATEQAFVRYRTLANLFNAVPRVSPIRLAVCKALVQIATENDELNTLNLSQASVDRWLTEWHASSEDKSEFLKSLSSAFEASGQPEKALAFSLAYVRSLSPSAAQNASLDLVASALRIPNYFDFDSVLRVGSLQSLKTHDLLALLAIFTKGGLDELRPWIAGHGALLGEYHLEAPQLERKMRLLTLADLGFSRIGQNLSYAEIAAALEIEEREVERWGFDVIREGLLAGKLSQTTKTLHVLRASSRGFTMDHWTALENRLLAWQESLAGIKNVLQSTRQNTPSLVVPEQAS